MKLPNDADDRGVRVATWAPDSSTWLAWLARSAFHWLDLVAPTTLARPGWLELAASRALARLGWFDLAALDALARPDLLDLAALNSLARHVWPALCANESPNA